MSLLPERYKNLPIEKKIGQMFIVGLPGEQLDESTYGLLESMSPAGVCLFARNTRDAMKTCLLIDAVRDAILFEPFVALDQEGGLVDRLRRIIEPMPSAKDLSLNENDAAIESLARITAETIRMLGFNMNFAPVVDVVTSEREGFTNGLQSRAFGRTASDVIRMTSIYLNALQEGGITGCLKHFPGIGAAKVDSHDELPLVEVEEAEFESTDLAPYREHFARGNAVAVMVGHAAYPQLGIQANDGNGNPLPSTLNPAVVTGLLRQKMGFEGVTLSDDMEMGAVVKNYGIGEASVLAIEAGIDLVLICNSLDTVEVAFRAVLQAVANGRISEERLNVSLERIATARAGLQQPLEFDKDRLNELSAEVADLKRSLHI